MKHPKVLFGTCIAVAAMTTAFLSNVHATPYASCITNNAGTIEFYLNESGGNVTVFYEDGTTNANYNGVTTGTNLASGQYSFALGAHTSYTISVQKVGTGTAAVIHSLSYGTPRGIDVNKNPSSPYFGNVYTLCASAPTPDAALRRLNSDLSGISTNSGGIAWTTSGSEPYRLRLAEDDYLVIGSFASAHSGVYYVDPTLTTGQTLLGPPGDTAGFAANSHGSEVGDCLLLGNLQNGDSCTLFTVDGSSLPFSSSQANSLLVYSNITLATLPWTNSPDLLGPEITLNIPNLNNNFPGLSVGPTNQSPRYIYITNRRDGPNGGSADLQIYALNNLVVNTGAPGGPGVDLLDPNSKGCVWNSYYNGTQNDYFAVNGTGPCDSSISPDGKYFAAEGYGNNQIIVCSLTNGIPDVTTLYTLTNPASQVAAGRGLAWDAADNIYLSSSGGGFFQEWTLGFTATAVTTGNASGPTGFSLELPSSVVSVVASNSLGGTSVSQENPYGNPTNATFTISRTGGIGSALTVFFSFSGTAATGTYTTSATGSITLAAGQSSSNVTVTAVSDGVARPTTTITLDLQSSAKYSLESPGSATLDLINTAPNQLAASTGIPTMYNAFSNDFASITITRLGDTNAASYTVNNFTFAGTAVEGVDYTAPTPVTFNPGDLTNTTYIYPLVNGLPPDHTTNRAYTGNKVAVIGVGTGSGYSPATNTAAITILDSAIPPETTLFADPLTDSADSANWSTTAANNDQPTHALDYTVDFGYDLQNGDPYGPIPPPPSGAATALRVTVNKNSAQGSGASSGVNLYPIGQSFSGDYAVRFSMNVIQGYNPNYSTEGPLFGINHNGMETNWWTGSGLVGTNITEWASDGIWYWTSADGDAALGDYVGFFGLGGALPNTGWDLAARVYSASFANVFKTNVFTSTGGPGLVANYSTEDSSIGEASANNWADVEIKQVNNIVTLSIDKTPIIVYANTNSFTSGDLMLGYDDPFSSVGTTDAAVYYSNLRVVRLGPPVITEIAPNNANNTIVINFTSVDGGVTASSFALQSSSTVNGTFTDDATATITSLGTAAFQAVVPQNGAMQFYRIRQK